MGRPNWVPSLTAALCLAGMVGCAGLPRSIDDLTPAATVAIEDSGQGPIADDETAGDEQDLDAVDDTLEPFVLPAKLGVSKPRAGANEPAQMGGPAPAPPPGPLTQKEKGAPPIADPPPPPRISDAKKPSASVAPKAADAAGKSSAEAKLAPMKTSVSEKSSAKTSSSPKGPTEIVLCPPPGLPTQPGPSSAAIAELSAEAAAITASLTGKESKVIALKPTDPASIAGLPRAAEKATAGKLTLDRLVFCQQIFGFGDIEPAQPDSLRPGEQALLYAEVKGFSSKEIEGRYETVLSGMITLESTSGQVVAPIEFRDVVDHCLARRTDFFSHYSFTLPANLAPGPYVLRLTIKDLHGGETAQARRDFVVHPPKP